MLDTQYTNIQWPQEIACNEHGEAMSFLNYVEHMETSGWNKLGAGGFAQVFERDGVVLKVCRQDPAYIRYMEHILTAQSNRAYPQISTVTVITGADETFHHIIMEQLSDFVPHMKRGEVSLEEIREFVFRIAIAESTTRGSYAITAEDEVIIAAMTTDERAALNEIIEIAHSNGFTIDFEHYNIMLRNDEIVFTDPLLRPDYLECLKMREISEQEFIEAA